MELILILITVALFFIGIQLGGINSKLMTHNFYEIEEVLREILRRLDIISYMEGGKARKKARKEELKTKGFTNL